MSRAAYECILLVACPSLFVGCSPREATLAVMRGWRCANPPPNVERSETSWTKEMGCQSSTSRVYERSETSWTKEMGCQSSTSRVYGFQTYRSFMPSALNSHTTPSDVTMLWQKPSVRVSLRLRGSSFYSEWEIIERDNVHVVLLCRHRYCKEERKEKMIGQCPC